MEMELSNYDYTKIIKYYNIKKQKNITKKQHAEDILANKLCKCIKKVLPYSKNESNAIGLCRNSIYKKRGIDFYNFKCKNQNKLIPKKGTLKKIKKFRKKIGFNKTKTKTKNKTKTEL